MNCSNLILVAIVMLTAQSVMSVPYEEIIAECKKIIGYNGDVKTINYNDPTVPSEAKCVLACGFEKIGVFKEDGSLDRMKERALVEEIIKEEKEKNKFLKAGEECDVSAKANKCETAFEYLKCVHNKAKDI